MPKFDKQLEGILNLLENRKSDLNSELNEQLCFLELEQKRLDKKINEETKASDQIYDNLIETKRSILNNRLRIFGYLITRSSKKMQRECDKLVGEKCEERYNIKKRHSTSERKKGIVTTINTLREEINNTKDLINAFNNIQKKRKFLTKEVEQLEEHHVSEFELKLEQTLLA